MSEVLKTTTDADESWQSILNEAEERYGADALFLYVRHKDKDFVVLTLSEAMDVCSHIAASNRDVLWATLDKLHDQAEILAARMPEKFEQAKAVGKAVLANLQATNE